MDFPSRGVRSIHVFGQYQQCINPFMYGMLNKNFRKDYLKMVCCRLSPFQATVQPVVLGGNANVVELNPLRVHNTERGLQN